MRIAHELVEWEEFVPQTSISPRPEDEMYVLYPAMEYMPYGSFKIQNEEFQLPHRTKKVEHVFFRCTLL